MFESITRSHKGNIMEVSNVHVQMTPTEWSQARHLEGLVEFIEEIRSHIDLDGAHEVTRSDFTAMVLTYGLEPIIDVFEPEEDDDECHD